MTNLVDLPVRDYDEGTWPANRKRGDFRRERREIALAQECRVYCAVCGRSKSAPLMLARAWFQNHKCRKGAA